MTGSWCRGIGLSEWDGERGFGVVIVGRPLSWEEQSSGRDSFSAGCWMDLEFDVGRWCRMLIGAQLNVHYHCRVLPMSGTSLLGTSQKGLMLW